MHNGELSSSFSLLLFVALLQSKLLYIFPCVTLGWSRFLLCDSSFRVPFYLSFQRSKAMSAPSLRWFVCSFVRSNFFLDLVFLSFLFQTTEHWKKLLAVHCYCAMYTCQVQWWRTAFVYQHYTVESFYFSLPATVIVIKMYAFHIPIYSTFCSTTLSIINCHFERI